MLPGMSLLLFVPEHLKLKIVLIVPVFHQFVHRYSFLHTAQLTHQTQCARINPIMYEKRHFWEHDIPEYCENDSCGHRRCGECYDLSATYKPLWHCDRAPVDVQAYWDWYIPLASEVGGGWFGASCYYEPHENERSGNGRILLSCAWFKWLAIAWTFEIESRDAADYGQSVSRLCSVF